METKKGKQKRKKEKTRNRIEKTNKEKAERDRKISMCTTVKEERKSKKERKE